MYLNLSANDVRDITVNATAAFNRAFDRAMQEDLRGHFASVFNSNTLTEAYHGLGPLGSMREWTDERKFSKLNQYSFELTNKKWEKSIALTRDEIEDDQLNMFMGRVQGLGAVAAYHKNEYATELLNDHVDGTTSRFKVGFDGSALFSTTHNWGSTAEYQSNQSNLRSGTNTGKLDLTYGHANLKSAINSLESFVGPDGKFIGLKASKLMVATDVYFDAKQILGPELMLAAAGNSDVVIERGKGNPLANEGLQLIKNRWLDSGHWILIADWSPVGVGPVIWQERRPTEFAAQETDASDSVFLREEYRYGVSGRYEVGAGLWFTCLAGDGT